MMKQSGWDGSWQLLASENIFHLPDTQINSNEKANIFLPTQRNSFVTLPYRRPGKM